MLFKTILNRTLKFKGFVFKDSAFGTPIKKVPTLEVEIVPRKNSKAVCSCCHQPRPGYDTLKQRRFEHCPLWGFRVFFLYKMRRVDCPKCGVMVEEVPWCKGKSHLTEQYSWFLASWAKKMSWQVVADCFKTTWYHVFKAVEYAVDWGRNHMDLENVFAIGVDEVLWHKGHKYLTLVYQIDEHSKRLLWIGENRREETFRKFFKWFGDERTKRLKFICSDMWKPFLNIIKEKASNAIHILDRYHIMANISKAIDKVRAEEVRNLKQKGEQPVLKKSRWIFLKRPENLTKKQDQKLAQLLKLNLKTIRAYLLKEDFQRLWDYVSPYWAGWFIDKWTTKVMLSKIEPMKKQATTIREHKSLILNWFKAKKRISAGTVEGLNNKVKLTFKKSYGFRTLEATEIQLYHAMGNLPTKQFTHRFF